jgi:hypothetical protein
MAESSVLTLLMNKNVRVVPVFTALSSNDPGTIELIPAAPTAFTGAISSDTVVVEKGRTVTKRYTLKRTKFSDTVTLNVIKSGPSVGALTISAPISLPASTENQSFDVTITLSSSATGTVYPFSITASGGNLNTSTSTDVVANSPQTIEIAPIAPSINTNTTQQFNIVVKDSLNNIITSDPAQFNWTITPNTAEISANGLVTAGTSTGTYSVTAAYKSNPTLSATTTLTVSAITAVTLIAAPSGSGTINITNGTLTGVAGRSVTITATSTPAYAFTRFDLSDGTTQNTPVITFPVNTNITVTAVFATVTIAPANLATTIVQGNTVSNTINITRTNYTGNVRLEIAGLPTGVTRVITPNPTIATEFVITLTAAVNATVTSVPVTVSCTATYGNRTATTSFQLTVAPAATPSLTLSATPVSMQKSATAISTISAQTTNLTDQERRTTVTVTRFVPTTGANATVPAITFTDTGQLRITTTAASIPGVYTLTLTGTTASNPVVTATTTLTLTIRADDEGDDPPPPGNVPVTFSPSLTPLVFTYQRGTTVYPLPVQITATNNSSRQHTVRLDTNQQFNFIKNGITTTGTLTFTVPPNSSQAFAIVPLQGLFTVGGLLDGDTQFPITVTDS